MMRLHQWTKNILVLVPLFLNQSLFNSTAVIQSLIGFLAFSCLASATYILNDLLDLPADRKNTTKKTRALASGAIGIKYGVLVFCLLMLLCGLLATFLSKNFLLIMVCYLVLTLAYSFFLKSQEIIDVCVIAILHTFRILAGTIAIGAEHSFWLLAFSMFIFTSFALAKRVSELTNLVAENRQDAQGRGYSVSDLPLLTSAGMASGVCSVLVVALYINSDKVLENYNQPEILWILCPLFLYWIGRLWLMTGRGVVHEDPIVYVLKDTVSLLTLAIMGFVVALGFTL